MSNLFTELKYVSNLFFDIKILYADQFKMNVWFPYLKFVTFQKAQKRHWNIKQTHQHPFIIFWTWEQLY